MSFCASVASSTRPRRCHWRSSHTRLLGRRPRSSCRFDKLPFDFAQGLSLSNGKALSGAEGLAAAWRRVKANAGAAGVDGLTIEALGADAQVEAAWLAALREELHRKTYWPAEEEEGNREAGGWASRRCAG